MERKCDYSLILFLISIIVLVISTFLLYLTFSKTIDFMNGVISCEQVTTDSTQFQMNNKDYNI